MRSPRVRLLIALGLIVIPEDPVADMDAMHPYKPQEIVAWVEWEAETDTWIQYGEAQGHLLMRQGRPPITHSEALEWLASEVVRRL